MRQSIHNDAKYTVIFLSPYLTVSLALSSSRRISHNPDCHATHHNLCADLLAGKGAGLYAVPLLIHPHQPCFFHQRFVITEQEGIVCILNTYSQCHPWITISERACFKSRRPLVHVFTHSGGKRSINWFLHQNQFIHALLGGGISQIWSLNLNSKFAEVWSDRAKMLSLRILATHMCLHSVQPQTQIKWQKLKGLKAHLFSFNSRRRNCN